MLLILTACQHLEKELTFEHPAPRALEDTFINAPSVLQSGCSQVAIKILHGTDVSGWRKLHTDFKNSLWDKSISFPSTGPCLPPRKTEEKCCESMSFLEWVKKGLQPAVECRRWQKLCLDKAKILHELTGILTARKGCRWWSTACEWRASVMGQSYSVTRQPGDMNSIHRAQSHSAPSHSTQYPVSLSDSANKHWTQCNKMVEIWAGSQ